jgi:hypothetical protein
MILYPETWGAGPWIAIAAIFAALVAVYAVRRYRRRER